MIIIDRAKFKFLILNTLAGNKQVISKNKSSIMKRYLLKVAILPAIVKVFGNFHVITVFILVLANGSFAQRTVAPATSLSPVETRSVVTLFSNADRKYYRMQFNAGKEIFGSRTINSTEKERIRKASLQEKGIIIICKESNSAIIYFKDGNFILAASDRTGANPFLNLLGKEKTEKLKEIISKHIEDPDIQNLDKPNLLGAPDT